MQLRRLSLVSSILLASISACAPVNNYDSTQDPFDEKPKVQRDADEMAAHVPRSDQSNPSQPLQLPAQNESPLISVPPIQPKISEVSDVRDSTDDMIDEALRLGRMGDMHGKALLLEQAGYTGNAEAFYLLAKMLQDGSIRKDDSAMFGFLSLAQGMGHIEASRVLGQLYIMGVNAPHDVSYGRLLLETAAEKSSRAALDYGLLLTNQKEPNLDDIDLGIVYLQRALNQGNHAASGPLIRALERNGMREDALVLRAQLENMDVEQPFPIETADMDSSLKSKALQGDLDAVYQYASRVLIRTEKVPEPEFTSYCWMSVAANLGHELASKELQYIEGIRRISEHRNPGRLDQCIERVQYQVSGALQ